MHHCDWQSFKWYHTHRIFSSLCWRIFRILPHIFERKLQIHLVTHLITFPHDPALRVGLCHHLSLKCFTFSHLFFPSKRKSFFLWIFSHHYCTPDRSCMIQWSVTVPTNLKMSWIKMNERIFLCVHVLVRSCGNLSKYLHYDREEKKNRIIMALHPELEWQHPGIHTDMWQNARKTTVMLVLYLNYINNNPKRRRNRERESGRERKRPIKTEREKERDRGSPMKKRSDYVPGSLLDLRILCLWMKSMTSVDDEILGRFNLLTSLTEAISRVLDEYKTIPTV